jgi:hypothetical protein
MHKWFIGEAAWTTMQESAVLGWMRSFKAPRLVIA